MNGIVDDASYLAAIFGATLGVVSFGIYHIREMRRKIRFYSFVTEETDAALISADRVLKNGATPAVVRKILLCMLETMATDHMGRAFTEHYVSLNEDKKKRKPGGSSELAEAMDKLHAQNPSLAADAHSALMGLILAIPLKHADKIEVLEFAGEGATNPSNVFAKAAKALSVVNHDNGKTGVGGGGLAVA